MAAESARELIRAHRLGPALAQLERDELSVSLHEQDSRLWLVDADDASASAAGYSGPCVCAMPDRELLVVAGMAGKDARLVVVSAAGRRDALVPGERRGWIVAFEPIAAPFVVSAIELDAAGAELARHRLEWEDGAAAGFWSRARHAIPRAAPMRARPRRTATYGRRRTR